MKLTKSRKGQMAIVMTLVIATLLGVMALGTDVGVMYYQWGQLQKGADAAALAGANYLAENLTGESIASTAGFNADATCKANYAGDDAKIAACTFAMNNYLSNASLTYTETAASATPNTPSIQVVATRSGLPYMFGRLIGLTTYSVVASATAYQRATGSTNGLFPMGVRCTSLCKTINLNPGAPVSFGQKFSPTGNASGNWQWLASVMSH
jgi:Flp pilus assembly protein TadG